MKRQLDIIPGVNIIGNPGQPAFQNGWGSLAGYGPFGFYKDFSTGLIIFQGIIQNSGNPGANSLVFTLPVGFRPITENRIITCSTETLANTFVWIEPDGDVTVVSDLGASALVYFEGTFFRP